MWLPGTGIRQNESFANLQYYLRAQLRVFPAQRRVITKNRPKMVK